MSKAPDSPLRSRTRSRTRSRSRSYSRSHSRSRSRSRSRKRRYSSRSRSRSRSHSPHRNYPSRDYQNNRGNYRGYNRGYRRPFQYRGRNRGYYPRGRYQNRGGNYGYRANNWQDDGGGGGRGGGRGGGGGGGGGGWHDQDHHHHHHHPQPHSPRRGRSRTPRKRSGSRSRSRYSDRSSSGHSRHSRRSSYSSRSHSPSPHHGKSGGKGKASAKEPKEKSGEGPSEAREECLDAPDGSSIEKVAGGKWIDYDASPKTAGAKEDTGGSGSKGPLWRTVGDDPPPKDESKSPQRAGQTATFGGFGFFSKEDPKAGDKTGITTAFKKFLAENKSADKDLDRQERDPEKSSGSSKAGSAYSLPASTASFREAKEEKVLPFFAAGEEEFLKAHGMKDSGEGLVAGGAKPQSALSSREMFGKWEEETGYPTSYPLPAKEKSRREAAAGDEAEPEESVYRSRKHKKEEKAKKKEKKEKEKEKEREREREREKNRRSPSPMPLPPPLRRGSKSLERDRPLFPAAMAACEGSPASRMSITRADFEQKMSAMDEMPGSSLPIERRASRELAAAAAAIAAIAPPKKDSEFRSVFNQMQLAQLRQSPSDLFAQHIVTIVHYIKAQHFRSSDMSLSERFAIYQRKAAEVEMMKPRKSPEIHRRIDLSPSAFKRHSHLFEDMEETSYKDPSKKVKGDVMDLRLDIERRKRFAGKESKRDGAKSSGGSRGPSRERSSEKAGKHHKKSKKSKKKRDRSPSSSSSSSSPSPYPPPFRGKDYGGEPPGPPGDHMEEGYGHGRYPPRDYAGPMDRGPRDYEGHNMDRGRGRGFFPRVRGRGWNRGGYPGGNNNNNSSNGNPANNMNPPVRPPDEEWDPEYTPKSRKYYLHDDRDGEKGWVDTRGRGRGGPFPARRGRFVYRKGGASPKWTHDMFQGGEEGELADDTMELEHKESKAEPAASK